jgi:hypothetical protein
LSVTVRNVAVRALTGWGTGGFFQKTSAPLSLTITYPIIIISAGSILLDSTFNRISWVLSVLARGDDLHVTVKRRVKEQQDFVRPQCSIRSALVNTFVDLRGQPNEQLDPVLAGGGASGLEEEAVLEYAIFKGTA